jgi:hypothetical protein
MTGRENTRPIDRSLNEGMVKNEMVIIGNKSVRQGICVTKRGDKKNGAGANQHSFHGWPHYAGPFARRD